MAAAGVAPTLLTFSPAPEVSIWIAKRGLVSGRRGAAQEYQTNHGHDGAVHVREIGLTDVRHNNKMERPHEEVRDREKVVRGLKSEQSPLLKGYQIYHSYMRPHSALGGRTPADASGIAIGGENKWLTIIQNASHVQPVNSEKKPEGTV